MAGTSKIEWTGSTWNPIRAVNKATGKVGWFCEHVSPGCEFCYAESMNRWRGAGVEYLRQNRDDVVLYLDDDMLEAPRKWAKGRRIFVCSMTDLFGGFVQEEWIDRMFWVMDRCPQHEFQVLTKRPEAMLLNIWAGVSIEDQRRSNERLQFLRAMPAEVRFLSCEPLLGPVDLGVMIGINWVIAGSESGRRAREADMDWFRSLRDQCSANDIPFFLKQFSVKGRKISLPLLDGQQWLELPR